jgi:hypothetical protein
VAKGVATGLQAATSEIGTSLAQTVTCATGGSKAGAAGRPAGEGQAQAPVKPAMAAAAGLGGIGVELLRVRGCGDKTCQQQHHHHRQGHHLQQQQQQQQAWWC